MSETGRVLIAITISVDSDWAMGAPGDLWNEMDQPIHLDPRVNPTGATPMSVHVPGSASPAH